LVLLSRKKYHQRFGRPVIASESTRLRTIVIEPLAAQDGGFAAIVPDLPGCMGDGETQREAVANVQDAIRA
jgi:antitoxin HicB